MDALAHVFRRLCFVDVETTGLDATTDDLLEVGLVYVELGVVTRRRQWLVRPTRAIPPLITALTGLSDRSVAGAPPLEAIEAELAEALGGWTLVAHNAAFERGFLGERIRANAVLDSCEVALLLAPEIPSHSLDALVRATGVGEGARHRALDDAEDTFAMLARLCEQHLAERRAPELGEILEHLGPPGTADRAALVEFLSALDAAPSRVREAPPLPRREPAIDELLAARLAGWLQSPTPVGLELEGPEPLATAVVAARRAAERSGRPVALAVPWRRLRELSLAPPAPIVPRRSVCPQALAEALRSPGEDEASRLGRAYLARWLRRTRSGDVDSVSAFLLARGGDARELVRATWPCRCESPVCPAHRAATGTEAPCVLVSHELALDWLERDAPVSLLVLAAEQLPDAERRRLTRRYHLPEEAVGRTPDEQALAEALAALPHGPVRAAQRLSPAWLAVRDAALALSRAQPAARSLAELVTVPPPGLELTAHAHGLTLAPHEVGADVGRRLRAGDCVLAGVAGGLSWLGQGVVQTSARPGARRVAWRLAPVPPEALAGLVREARGEARDPVLLLTGEPLAEVAKGCLAGGLEVTLDVRTGADARLLAWAGDARLPTASACVVYGVRELRRAVLASGAARVLVAGPRGLHAAEVERALRGLTC